MSNERNSGLLSPALPSLGRDVLWIASVALFYLAVARLSLLLVFRPEGIAAIWPAAGILLSALLLTRRDLRPWLAGTLFVLAFVAESLTGTPWVVSLIYTLTPTGGAVLSVWLLGRFVGEPITFQRVREVVGWLLLSVLLSNALVSLAAAAASQLLPGISFWNFWKWWAASDGIGNLLVTPLILSWAVWGRPRLRVRNPKRVLEGAALFILLVLSNWLAFSQLSEHGRFSLLLTYLTFPFLLWAALRFGVRGTASVMVVVAGIAIYFAAAGRVTGILAEGSELDLVIMVQFYLAIMAVPALFLAVVVTERRQAEEALRESESKFRAIIEASPVPFALNDEQQNITYLNAAFVKTFGYDRKDIPTLADWWPKAYPDAGYRQWVATAWQARLDEARQAGTPFEPVELDVRCKDGTVRNAIAGAVSLEERFKGVHLVILYDITERKRVADALHESEVKFRSLAEGALVGVVIIQEGRFKYLNPAMTQMLGYSQEEMLGAATVLDLVAEEDRALVQENLRRRQEGEEESIRYVFRARKKDGSSADLEVFGSRITFEGRSAVMSTVLDITGRKRAEAERERLQAALHRSEMMAAMGSLIAGVAHEVRNPLFGISATLDAFAARFGTQEGYQQYLTVLRGEVKRLTDLMQDLLEYGKPVSLALASQAIGEIIAATVAACASLADAAGVQLVVEGTATTAVVVDRDRLRQVLQNLLENAIQHAPRGSVVTVEVADTVRDGQAWIECVIKDPGPGFRAEDLRRVFEPFFSRRRGGTGLGLSIVQRIVEEHGGAVTASNRPEGGAVVTVRLPIR